MPCEAGADLGIDLMVYEKCRWSTKMKFARRESIPTAVGAGAEKEVIMIIVVESFLDGVIAGSKTPDHVAKFCH